MYWIDTTYYIAFMLLYPTLIKQTETAWQPAQEGLFIVNIIIY